MWATLVLVGHSVSEEAQCPGSYLIPEKKSCRAISVWTARPLGCSGSVNTYQVSLLWVSNTWLQKPAEGQRHHPATRSMLSWWSSNPLDWRPDCLMQHLYFTSRLNFWRVLIADFLPESFSLFFFFSSCKESLFSSHIFLCSCLLALWLTVFYFWLYASYYSITFTSLHDYWHRT